MQCSPSQCGTHVAVQCSPYGAVLFGAGWAHDREPRLAPWITASLSPGTSPCQRGTRCRREVAPLSENAALVAGLSFSSGKWFRPAKRGSRRSAPLPSAATFPPGSTRFLPRGGALVRWKRHGPHTFAPDHELSRSNALDTELSSLRRASLTGSAALGSRTGVRTGWQRSRRRPSLPLQSTAPVVVRRSRCRTPLSLWSSALEAAQRLVRMQRPRR